ncbi:hypothetical protein FD724_37635 (plasmid) [Nostoc sp. C057]|nr:hypothetical protein FD724_37635 [Nostoc sp. C057]
MSQIEIAQIIDQIKQEITVDSNGQGKASLRATARLAGVDAAGLFRSLKTAGQTHLKYKNPLINTFANLRGFNACRNVMNPSQRSNLGKNLG